MKFALAVIISYNYANHQKIANKYYLCSGEKMGRCSEITTYVMRMYKQLAYISIFLYSWKFRSPRFVKFWNHSLQTLVIWGITRPCKPRGNGFVVYQLMLFAFVTKPIASAKNPLGLSYCYLLYSISSLLLSTYTIASILISSLYISPPNFS